MSEYKIFNADYDKVITAKTLRDWIVDDDPHSLERTKKLMNDFHTDTPIEVIDPQTPRTFLLDCSGSMRGKTIFTAIATMLETGDALHSAGTPFEILGHTTTAWKGGRVRQGWMDQGRPENPGRLNELLHIVVKTREESWPEARENLFGLLRAGLLKENIDGEAVAWAARRMHSHQEPGQMIIFSDGTPMDDATLAYNNPQLLDDHLLQVLDAEKEAGLNISTVSICNKYQKEQSIYPDAALVLMTDASDHSKNTAAMLIGVQVAMAKPRRELCVEEASPAV